MLFGQSIKEEEVASLSCYFAVERIFEEFYRDGENLRRKLNEYEDPKFFVHDFFGNIFQNAKKSENCLKLLNEINYLSTIHLYKNALNKKFRIMKTIDLTDNSLLTKLDMNQISLNYFNSDKAHEEVISFVLSPDYDLKNLRLFHFALFLKEYKWNLRGILLTRGKTVSCIVFDSSKNQWVFKHDFSKKFPGNFGNCESLLTCAIEDGYSPVAFFYFFNSKPTKEETINNETIVYLNTLRQKSKRLQKNLGKSKSNIKRMIYSRLKDKTVDLNSVTPTLYERNYQFTLITQCKNPEEIKNHLNINENPIFYPAVPENEPNPNEHEQNLGDVPGSEQLNNFGTDLVQPGQVGLIPENQVMPNIVGNNEANWVPNHGNSYYQAPEAIKSPPLFSEPINSALIQPPPLNQFVNQIPKVTSSHNIITPPALPFEQNKINFNPPPGLVPLGTNNVSGMNSPQKQVSPPSLLQNRSSFNQPPPALNPFGSNEIPKAISPPKLPQNFFGVNEIQKAVSPPKLILNQFGANEVSMANSPPSLLTTPEVKFQQNIIEVNQPPPLTQYSQIPKLETLPDLGVPPPLPNSGQAFTQCNPEHKPQEMLFSQPTNYSGYPLNQSAPPLLNPLLNSHNFEKYYSASAVQLYPFEISNPPPDLNQNFNNPNSLNSPNSGHPNLINKSESNLGFQDYPEYNMHSSVNLINYHNLEHLQNWTCDYCQYTYPSETKICSNCWKQCLCPYCSKKINNGVPLCNHCHEQLYYNS